MSVRIGREAHARLAAPAVPLSLRSAARRFGPRDGHLIVLGAGVGLAALVGLAIGLAARVFETFVDVRLYEWLVGQFSASGWWPELAAFYTQIGDPMPMIVQTAVATVAFAIVYGVRWWIPVLLLPVGLAAEYTVQKGLEHVIARGHPFAGAGTFPSGGSARFVVVYGLVAFLALLRWPRLRRYWAVIAVLVALLAGVEGYTRLYLLMHWPTDVIGGWVIGGILLAALVSSAVVAVEGEAMRLAIGRHRSPKTRPPSA